MSLSLSLSLSRSLHLFKSILIALVIVVSINLLQSLTFPSSLCDYPVSTSTLPGLSSAVVFLLPLLGSDGREQEWGWMSSRRRRMKISHHTYQTNNYTLSSAVAPTPFDRDAGDSPNLCPLEIGCKWKRYAIVSFVHFRLEQFSYC